jgi:Ca-activated chloride channel family protein
MPGHRLSLLIAVLALLSLASPLPALADGIIIPEPPICDPGPCPHPIPITQLAIEYHRVEVVIEDQVATTHVDQVFRNDNDWTVEGTYIFPIPVGAAVSSFTMWMDGRPVEGRVLDREEARRIYEDIVRSLRDPALLEYVDRGAVQASIFPIPAGGESRVELEYTEVLPADAGLLHYVYPLNTERFSTEPLEDVSVSVEVRSPEPIRSVYSPSHDIAISREDDNHFRVGYEESDVRPDRDFELYYSVAADDIGLNLLTYRDPESEDGDGFFLLLAAPSVEHPEDRIIAKDVIIVLDQSGSMDGEKFEQAQTAVRYIIENLNAEDRFNIIAFSTGLRPYADRLQPADEAGQARRWVEHLAAEGATDINRALLEAASQVGRARPTLLIFLTDGLPTEGVTDREAILENLGDVAPSNLRLFTFGVGYDVDTVLLDSLAQGHHGTSTYVTPGQALDEAISGFYARVSSPVLTDIELALPDVVAYDLYPDPLPDLFRGSQLVLVGRYREPGGGEIVLSGTVDGEARVLRYDDQTFRAAGGPSFLPRLWATRKIGHLLNRIRIEGPEEELVDQVVRLSIRYGIVTPYTSYLVTEPEVMGANSLDGLVQEEFQRMMAAPTQVSGQDAVERAAAEGGLGGAMVPAGPSAQAANVVRLAGGHTFRLVEGVWVDTTFDPETMDPVRIPFVSQDYFILAASRSDLGAALSLGSRVIVVIDDVAYEVVEEGASGDQLVMPPALDTSGPSQLPPGRSGTEPTGQDVGRRGLQLPCPGVALLMGGALLPFRLRRDRTA